MMIKESSAEETIKELKDVVSKEPVLIKIIPDTDFNLMFGKTVNETLNLPQDTIHKLAMEAHKNDITLNQQLNRVLTEAIAKEKMSFTKGIVPNAETEFSVNEVEVDGKLIDFNTQEEAKVSKDEINEAIDNLIK